MRAIDADALKSYMDECSKESKFRVYYAYAESFINYAPTIDAVPVVRCKDCLYSTERYGHMECINGVSYRNTWNKPDFYCAYGEQKGGDD